MHGLISIIVIAILVLSGCTSPKMRLSVGEGPTMKQILEGQRNGTNDRNKLDSQLHNHLLESESATQRLYPRYEQYTRDSVNEINQLFPKHLNPTITVYVLPHLATDNNSPIPGYTTAFNLYRTDEYALPSEVPPAYVPFDRTKHTRDPHYLYGSEGNPVLVRGQ